MNNTKYYRYGMNMRPAGFGATPKGHVAVEPCPDFRHGVLVMDRELTDEERTSYELVKIPEPQELVELALRIAESAREYAAEHLEEMRDPRTGAAYFRQFMAGRHIDDSGLHIKDMDALYRQVEQTLVDVEKTKKEG